MKGVVSEEGFRVLEAVAHAHARMDDGTTTEVTFKDDEQSVN
jgi:hypothetical protein